MLEKKRPVEAGSLPHLARSAVGTFGLKIGLVALSFATSLLLARLLGTRGYGVYTYCVAWVALLQVPAELGSRMILAREVSLYQSTSQWALLKGLLRWLNATVLCSSVAVTLLAIACVWVLGDRGSSDMRLVLYIALAMLPLLALAGVRQGTMQGLHSVVLGQLPENLLQPICLIASIGVVYVAFSQVTVAQVMILKGISIGVAFGVGVVLLRRQLPVELDGVRQVSYDVSRWTRSLLPFLLISSTHVINARTDILMLGTLSSPEASGIYTVASRGASFITFVLVAVNMPLGPAISRLYSRGDLKTLQQTVQKSTRVVFLASLPMAVILILFNQWFLLLFGSEFLQGGRALVILCCAQLVNALAGSVGTILDMTGHERDSAMGIGISAAINIALNAVLIPRYGLEGAAIATASSIVFWNVFLLFFVHKRVGISSTIFGWI